MRRLLDKILCKLGWHRWDDEHTGRPFPGLNCSYCAICEKKIHHGAAHHRGHKYGRELK